MTDVYLIVHVSFTSVRDNSLWYLSVSQCCWDPGPLAFTGSFKWVIAHRPLETPPPPHIMWLLPPQAMWHVFPMCQKHISPLPWPRRTLIWWVTFAYCKFRLMKNILTFNKISTTVLLNLKKKGYLYRHLFHRRFDLIGKPIINTPNAHNVDAKMKLLITPVLYLPWHLTMCAAHS